VKAKKISIPDNLTSIDEVLEATNMMWIAEQHELITGSGINVPNHKAIVRADNKAVLGIVGQNYQPVQNTTAFAFLDTLVQKNKAVYENVFEVDNGSRMIVQAKLDNDFDVRAGDTVASYITMMNSFDGSTPFKVFFTPIRLFCTNQLTRAWRSKADSITIKHTANVEAKADEAFKVLCAAQKYFEQFKVQSIIMAQKILDKKMVENFISSIFNEEEKRSTKTYNIIDEVLELSENGKGNNGNTVWDLYNGVTEYVDWYRGKDDDKRIASALLGSGNALKDKAWVAAVNLC